MDILIEKINVSDDKFLLSELFVSNGDKVIKGTKIYTIESSKAAIDVEAPCDGYIYFNEGVEEMEQYPAGFCIAKIVDTAINPFERKENAEVSYEQAETAVCTSAQKADEIPEGTTFTPAALQLIKKHGINANAFKNKFVAKGDVLKVLNQEEQSYKGNDIVIVGGGGLGKMQIDAIHENHCYNIIGILDDALPVGSALYGYKVLGGIEEMLPILYDKGVRLAANSIGSIAASQSDAKFTLRKRMAEKIKSIGYIIPNIVHPKATIESSVKMGEGNIIMAGAYIGSDAVLGDNCLINNHAIISHDCILGDCVRVSPNATLAGAVEIGDNSLVGMNTTVFIGIKIGANAIVYNGANVFSNVADNSIAK